MAHVKKSRTEVKLSSVCMSKCEYPCRYLLTSLNRGMVFAFLTVDILTWLTKQFFSFNIKIIPTLQYNYIILLKIAINIVSPSIFTLII